MKNLKKYLPYILILIILAIAIYIWLVVLSNKDSKMLKVAFLDVGQGDAIYIETPNKKQVLIDGGKDSKLIYSLSKVMPFADRSLDLVIITHRDMDHIGGLPILFESYRVDRVIDNGAKGETEVSNLIDEKIQNRSIEKVIARDGMRITLDQKRNIYLDIIYPNKEIEGMDLNDGSVVAKLIYGQNSFLFTGDAGVYAENLIMWEETEGDLDIDVLKLGHHGARSSSSLLWLEKTSPSLAVISAGKNNSYEHPHQEVLDRLENLKIPFLSTIDIGTILIKSDGQKLIY
jgi:competence protein ComEC